MSTLTDYENVSNQNILSGINRSEQCFVRAQDPSLFPETVLPCTSYGSGQYDGSLYETAYNSADKFSTVPSLCSPMSSDNNNSRTDQVPSTSSVYEEDLDDDGCILSDLPKSCQDFEVKERHIRLERNQSSPLVAGHISPGHSSRVSSNCPSVEPPAELTEPEDLEVQWINESFEEQQKQSKMYQSGDLKTLFYNASDQDSSKGTTRSNTEKSGCSPVDRPDRLPYVKKLLSQDSSGSLLERPVTPTRMLKPEQSFEPLLTPKSEALIQQKLNKTSAASSRRRVSEPVARKARLFWNADSSSDISVCDGVISDVFDLPASSSSAIQDVANSRHVSFASNEDVCETSRSLSNVSLPVDSFETDTEQLARGVVESLFDATGSTPIKSMDAPEIVFDRAVGRVVEDEAMKAKEGVKCEQGTVLTSDGAPGGHLSAPAVEEPGDSWEDLDDDALSNQLAAVKLEVADKAKPKRFINYFEKPQEDTIAWDKMLMPHVLEAFNIPDYKLCDDVEAALKSLGYGSAVVKWIERKIVLVAFECERQANDAVFVKQHPWLKLRPLHKSEAATKRAALENEKYLRPTKRRPKTHVGVARRMVEGALGKKSAISQDQRQAETKQLRDARAAKKLSKSAWDD